MVIAIVIIILGAVAIPGLRFPLIRKSCAAVQITATIWAAMRRISKRPSRNPSKNNWWARWHAVLPVHQRQQRLAGPHITFKLGTNPDMPPLQTREPCQRRAAPLAARSPAPGCHGQEGFHAFLMAVSLVASDDRYDALFLTNYAQINLVNQIGSLYGVGESRLSSQQVYSMRVWLIPIR